MAPAQIEKDAAMKDSPPENSLAADEIDNRLFFRLFQTANTLHTKGTQALETVGVTTGKWSVLGALCRPQARTGMSIGDLCRYLLVSRQHLSAVLNRLEQDGLIERTAGEDRRSRHVRMTRKGEALWLTMGEPIRSFYGSALKGFSFDDKLEFIHHLTRLQRNMSQD